MIVRVLTATLPVANTIAVHELMRQQLPLLRAHDGLIYVKLARRLVDVGEELVLFEEWRDVDAMLVWTGPDIARPRLLPGAEDLIDELDITHFEALDINGSVGLLAWGGPDERLGEAASP
jgi:hypothetical protein